MLRVAILGSTGSVGRQALEVAAAHPERVSVVGLAAHRAVDAILAQARVYGVRHVALADESAATAVRGRMSDTGSVIGAGPEAVASLADISDADLVLNALVGFAGLRSTMYAVRAGKTVALANKESLVVAGDLIMRGGAQNSIIPVDSEHSAIFQCLLGEDRRRVSKIWLTASGGPFLGRTRAELEDVTADQALAHPTWSMGRKISVDSATLMNKGLEVIEAHHLFGVAYDNIRVVVHPQSCVHSMVEFVDGSVKAHLGTTDMRIPIQYALSGPDRWSSRTVPVDFATIGTLSFEAPDEATFRCLDLAYEAGRVGGTMPTAMNAANEIAVGAFLSGRCTFTAIDEVVSATMEAHVSERVESLEHLEVVDSWARERALDVLCR